MMPYLVDGLMLAFLLYLMIIGLRDGFFDMLGRLLTTFVSLIVTLLLIGPATQMVNGIPVVAGLMGKMTDGILEPLRKSLTNVPSIIAGFNLPPFLEKLMLSELADSDPTSSVLYDSLAASIARFTLTALLFLLIFATAAILIRLLTRMVTRLVNGLPVLGFANRLAGMAAGLAYGLLIVSIILLLAAFFAPHLPRVVEAIEETFLISVLYRQNLLLLIF